MKKTRILIAMFAVIATASAARAEINLDFDGKNAGSIISVNFAIAKSEINQDIPEIPAPVMAKADTDIKNEEYELNRSIGSAIKDCDKKGFVALKPKFEKLLTMGNLQEKRDFVYNTNRSYDFPRRLFTGTENTLAAAVDAVNDLRTAKGTCIKWERKETCVTGRKEVCHTTCAAATLICLAVAPPAAPVCTWGTPACQIACTFVDDTVCTWNNVCVAEYEPPSCDPSIDSCPGGDTPRKHSTRD